MSHAVDQHDLAYARKRADVIGWVPGVQGKNGKINPNVSRFILKDGRFLSVFHTKPVYYETRAGFWRPLTEVCEYHGNHQITLKLDTLHRIHPRYLAWLEKRCDLINGDLGVSTPFGNPLWIAKNTTLSAGLATTTFYPDPDTESTTVDGYVENINDPKDWEVTRDSTSGSATSDSATSADTRAGVTSGNLFNIYRTFFLFDTSSIGSDTVDSGTFSLYVTQTFDEDDDAQAYIAVTKTNPASNTAIVTGDYDAVEGTDNTIPLTADQAIKKLSSTELDISSATTSAYNDFTLNSNGTDNVNTSGVSDFGAAEGHDIEDVPVAGSSLTRSVLRHSMAEVSGTSQDPKLAITHSAGGGPTFIPKAIMF